MTFETDSEGHEGPVHYNDSDNSWVYVLAKAIA